MAAGILLKPISMVRMLLAEVHLVVAVGLLAPPLLHRCCPRSGGSAPAVGMLTFGLGMLLVKGVEWILFSLAAGVFPKQFVVWILLAEVDLPVVGRKLVMRSCCPHRRPSPTRPVMRRTL